MSLRSTAIVQPATLPDGREIVVRVGIPDDPYIAKRDLDTVSLELREGERVVAAVNTVLDADDDEGASELAREVVAKLSSGELEPTAGAIEALADEPR